MLLSERSCVQSGEKSCGSEKRGGMAVGEGRVVEVVSEDKGCNAGGSVGIVRAGGGEGWEGAC